MLKIKDLAPLLSKFHTNTLTDQERHLLQCWKSEPVFNLLKCLKPDPYEFEKKLDSIMNGNEKPSVKRSTIKQITPKVKIAKMQDIHLS